MSKLCVELLWYGEQPNDIARQLNLFENKIKALNPSLNSAE
jgi:hypothetical protein